jgi:RNA polymerase sigma-70 factor (ECF subfamily)
VRLSPWDAEIARAIVAGVPAELAASQLGISVDEFHREVKHLFRRFDAAGRDQFVAVLRQAHDAWLMEVTVPLGCHLRANPSGAAELPNEHRFVEILAFVTPDEKRPRAKGSRAKRSKRVWPSAAEKFALPLADGRKQAARDAIAAAYDRAVRRLHTFRGESKLRTWFFRIVRNEVFRLVELPQRRNPRRADEIHFSDEASRRTALQPGQEWSEQLRDPCGTDPLLRLVVEETVASLPPRQRQICEVVTTDPMSRRQAAGLLRISENNLRVNLHIAQTRVRQAIGLRPRKRCRKGPRL